MSQRISIIEWLYAAISRNDMEAIWACVAADAVWEQATESKSLRWLTVARGRDAVVRALRSVPDVSVRVEPQSFNETSTVVAVTVRIQATVASRSEGDADWSGSWTEVHHWEFDAAGMICRLRQRGETTAHLLEAGGGRLFPFA